MRSYSEQLLILFVKFNVAPTSLILVSGIFLGNLFGIWNQNLYSVIGVHIAFSLLSGYFISILTSLILFIKKEEQLVALSGPHITTYGDTYQTHIIYDGHGCCKK